MARTDRRALTTNSNNNNSKRGKKRSQYHDKLTQCLILDNKHYLRVYIHVDYMIIIIIRIYLIHHDNYYMAYKP